MSTTVFVVCCSTVGARKIFGTGTKLVITNTAAKLDATKIQILPIPHEQDGKVTYMCLIEDFYPNVIKVTWEDDKKNAEQNAVYGEIWSPDINKNSYSVSSWLTVDKLRSKNYRCKYQHEAEREEHYVPIISQDTSVESQPTGDSTNNPQSCRTLFKESSMHRTAYLIYTVLLLKSTMYYVIVLFFMYRMRSPIKRHGKKP